MKTFYILLFLAPFLASAQLKTSDQGSIYYEEIVQADSLTQKEIHSKIYQWFAINFNDSNSVIKMNTENKIIGNGNSNFTINSGGYPVPSTLKYSMIIEIKEGRYKILIDNVTNNIQGFSNPVAKNKLTYEEWLEVYKEQIQGMDDILRKASEKLLKNEKHLKETYEMAINVQEQIFENAESIIIDFSQRLKKTLKSNYDNDW